MVLETLTRSQKLGLLGLLVGIGVAAVVIPLVAVGGGGGDDRGNNLTQAEVLKQIRKELRDMAEQLRIHLNSTTTTSPPPASLDKGAEENAAKVSVESRRRKKRQAPNLPPPPAPQQAPTAPLTTVLPAAPLNATNVANNSIGAGSSSSAPPAADTNVTSTVATISTTISPLLLLVDETSNVLEMLEKTDKQILEAANSSASSSPGEEAQLVGKIAQLRAKVGRIELHSPADKQLASDLLTRVLTAEQDVTRTLEAVQVKEVEVVAKRKQQAVSSLSRMNSTLSQLLNNLSLKLNSPLTSDQQIPANGSVLVANTSAGNTSLADGSVTNSQTEGVQNSSIVSFSTLQTELAEELETGTQTLTGLADNPDQLSAQTQTVLDSLEKSLDRLTAALPTLTVKEEEERGAGRVLLASLEGTKREASRALASLLLAGGQQASSSVNETNLAVGPPPSASNGTLAGGEQVGISAVSEAVPGAQSGGVNGGAAVDVTSSTTAAAAAAAATSPSSSAAATATPSPPGTPASSPPQ